jgi:hypothetical protein
MNIMDKLCLCHKSNFIYSLVLDTYLYELIYSE